MSTAENGEIEVRISVGWCAAALLCLVSLSDASLQFAPLAAPPDGECALLLDGPGRTSAFDYNLNALRGTL
uniref:Uncharacterized protein n=1 Tax=Timema douglasi TaxID=61478 RepID=A0A7R8V9C3_TIMDO|nr:unnamed protein product [Timema douglasi]